MKLLSIIVKSLKEQWRSFWILLLTLSMGPFFMFVYYLILESSKPHYDVAIINNDKGYITDSESINKGEEYILFFTSSVKDSVNMPFSIKKSSSRSDGLADLKNKKSDAFIIIPEDFSKQLIEHKNSESTGSVEIQFFGDLTSVNYLLSALWANETLNSFIKKSIGSGDFIRISETGIGSSSKISDFDLIVPGILIVSVIMLMFTATIAFVSEVENKTILRLKLSRITTFEFIAGITVVQLIVGIISILLTLITAAFLGFEFQGSAAVFILIAVLTSLSIIAFSLIIAALTKTANEVLVVGNFPLFLFMFFTGAAFPFRSEGLFNLFDYPVSLQGLMSPTHAISALNKIIIMQMKLSDIIPEILALIILTIIYFFIGMILFRKNHMQLK
ncbi:MAG: ABC transporter permease [Bacteroidales bacterium]|nr:ABC transporter permease [Bacteroidales bacterium]